MLLPRPKRTSLYLPSRRYRHRLMKIRLNENLPVDLAEPLMRLGHEVDTVVQEDLTGRDDQAVWKAAQEEGRFLISASTALGLITECCWYALLIRAGKH